MKRNSEDKAERILSIYSRLKQGRVIYKEQESMAFAVAPRTIQRDIADIQCFLQNRSSETGEIEEIVFDKGAGGYRLETKICNHLSKEEVLAVCKILLESRALVKAEILPIIYKLLGCLSEEKDRKFVKELLDNEIHHYVELRHGKKLLEILYTLEKAVKNQCYIKIEYERQKEAKTVERVVKPVGIMFSEFYFYMTAFIEDIDKEKEFQNPKDIYPTIYRVDHIKKVYVLQRHFSVPYTERFEEGEFRKRIQFMYGGTLRTVIFQYNGGAIDNILDRLPTARIIKKDKDVYTIRAEVFGKGIEFWLASQKDYISNVKYS